MADENPDLKNPPEPLRLKTLAEQKYVAGNLKSALKYAKRAHRLQPSLEALPEMLTAFNILRTATKPITSIQPYDEAVLTSPAPPDYYKILQIERFAHINTIKKQYKKLALTLHPDKNPFTASEEAFKHVGEAFRVLSDRIRRKDYDMRLRIAMQNEAEAAAGVGVEEVDTFWTACSTCRLLHKFERKYLGHNLVCPSCRKSFKAVEVVEEDNTAAEKVEEGGILGVGVRISERIKARKLGKMSSVGEVLKRSRTKNVVLRGKRVLEKELGKVGKEMGLDSSGGVGVIGGLRSRSGRKEERGGGVEVVARTKTRKRGLRSRSGRKEERGGGVEVVARTKTRKRTERVKVDEEEMMTLAEMQMLAKKKVSEEKMKLKGKEKEMEKEGEKEKEKEKEMEKEKVKETDKDMGNEEVKENENENEKELENEEGNEEVKEKENEKEVENEELMEKGIEMESEKEDEIEKDREKKKQKLNENERKMGIGKVKEREKRERKGISSNEKNMEIVGRRASKSSRDLVIEKRKRPTQNNREIVAVEDSDFYDFDKDRVERSFKKGQVWAIYDSEDGMPRHYALIDEVVSLNPFQVRLSWLEFQSNGDELLISLEKMGFHISSGRFKVSDKASVKSLKMFSHLADCERAAREVYRIYPKKGSVWALYSEKALDSGRNQILKDKGCYDIVVFLTSYSEIHGLSMAYLEKVDGFKTIFKRKDIGAHAIRRLEKDDFRLFSHQIPGRKLSGEEAPGLPRDCWELDPASLPPDSLNIS